MVRQSFEGTWEEIAQHAAELAGRRVRLTVLEDAPKGTPPAANGKPAPAQTLDVRMKDYIGSVSSGTPHNTGRRSEEIFGEIVMEKRRKERRQ